MTRTQEAINKSLDQLEQGLEEVESGTGAGTMITTALISAAVGAGVALLYAPQEGSKTRREVSERLSDWQDVASSGISEGIDFLSSNAGRLGTLANWRNRRRARDRRRAALLGTLAGAGVALLFAPTSGSRLRRNIGRQVNELKDDASEKYRQFRQERRSRGTADTEPDGSDRVVRTVEELGREASEVF